MIFACGLCGGSFEAGALAIAGGIGILLPYVHDRVILAARRAERAALAAMPREAGGPLAARDIGREPRGIGREATRLAISERTAS